ncbi:MAG TPA: DUF2764 family protein [Spirochaetia bacterium]|nr:DUF2764 family protein [Spirochaetia bacterium]
MTRKYYYLAASLPDLFRGRSSAAGTVEEFLGFCSEVLHPEDLADLMQIFLFNDLRNAADYLEKDDPFVGPCIYEQRELLALRGEPDPAVPFIGRYLSSLKEGERRFPQMAAIDEAITFFYEDIHQVSDDFIRSYFLHELELRNIATALELRSNGFDLKHKLIPLGDAFERLSTGSEEGWGLSEQFPYVKALLPLYDDPDLTARESALDEIRWQWCDEQIADELFGFHTIVAYGIKLLSVERWSGLDETAGNELFMELLGTVQRSVRFAIEFSHLTEEQREERRRQIEAERTAQAQAGEEKR